MVRWTDYLISEVVYNPNHLIVKAKRYHDDGNGAWVETIVDRLTIASDIKKGKSYMTIYDATTSWRRGNKLQTFHLDGQPYIRIDKNKVGLDFLGDIPELQGYESELKQLTAPKSPRIPLVESRITQKQQSNPII